MLAKRPPTVTLNTKWHLVNATRLIQPSEPNCHKPINRLDDWVGLVGRVFFFMRRVTVGGRLPAQSDRPSGGRKPNLMSRWISFYQRKSVNETIEWNVGLQLWPVKALNWLNPFYPSFNLWLFATDVYPVCNFLPNLSSFSKSVFSQALKRSVLSFN